MYENTLKDYDLELSHNDALKILDIFHKISV
jgi:hypothetical protein